MFLDTRYKIWAFRVYGLVLLENSGERRRHYCTKRAKLSGKVLNPHIVYNFTAPDFGIFSLLERKVVDNAFFGRISSLKFVKFAFKLLYLTVKKREKRTRWGICTNNDIIQQNTSSRNTNVGNKQQRETRQFLRVVLFLVVCPFVLFFVRLGDDDAKRVLLV
tara:strand:- start:5369 stop:5854 length:486 start_codon:yes stop_codon:yes gene_type:complete